LAALGDILQERKSSLNPRDYPDQLFNYIGLENVASLTGDLVNFAPKIGREIKSVSKLFQAGDILYGRLRPYLNKVYLAEVPVASGVCSGEFYVMMPETSKILPRFLRTLLASEYVQQYVRNWQTGSALPRLSLDDLLEIQIPLPPLELQVKYEGFIQAAESSRRELTQRVERLPQALMDSVLDGLQQGSEKLHLRM
jgi:type I restriction enzyme S subunit